MAPKDGVFTEGPHLKAGGVFIGVRNPKGSVDRSVYLL